MVNNLITELEKRINYAKNFGDGKSDVIISREKLIELNREFLAFVNKVEKEIDRLELRKTTVTNHKDGTTSLEDKSVKVKEVEQFREELKQRIFRVEGE